MVLDTLESSLPSALPPRSLSSQWSLAHWRNIPDIPQGLASKWAYTHWSDPPPSASMPCFGLVTDIYQRTHSSSDVPSFFFSLFPLSNLVVVLAISALSFASASAVTDRLDPPCLGLAFFRISKTKVLFLPYLSSHIIFGPSFASASALAIYIPSAFSLILVSGSVSSSGFSLAYSSIMALY